MSYFIQCDCGKKLTKKPMKTLICPKCHSVYRKSKKFIYFIYFFFVIFTIIAISIVSDNIILSIAYGLILDVFLWLFLVYYLDIDLLDLIILINGLIIFFYLGNKYDNYIIFAIVSIIFCWISAEFFIRFFKYKKIKSKE